MRGSKKHEIAGPARIVMVSACVVLMAGTTLSDAFARGGGFARAGFSRGAHGHSEYGNSEFYRSSSMGYHSRAFRSYARWHPPYEGGCHPGRGPIWHPAGWHRHHSPIYGWTPDGADESDPAPSPSHGIRKAPHHTPPVSTAAHRATGGSPAANETRFVPDEVLFTVKGSSDTAQSIARRHHLTLVSAHRLNLIGATLNRYRITDHRSVAQVVRELEGEETVASAQPNYIFKLEGAEAGVPSLAAAEYALEKMHVIEAHHVTEGDQSRIAIINSEIDGEHPDLVGSIAERFEAVEGDAKPEAHGTAVASVITAHSALLGVAPHAKILAIHAFSEGDAKPGAEGTSAHVIEGLSWAFEHKARLVNMSFAGPRDPLLAQALDAAHKNGMILVAAAGNEGPNAAPAYPAADPNVIAVTATDRDDKLFAAANHGSYITLAAPGADIIVAAPSRSYQFSSGTSIAAAQVSGIIALLLSEKPDLSADATRKILTETAEDLGAPGQDADYGAGLGDAAKAVAITKTLSAQQVAKDSLPPKAEEALAGWK